RWREQAEELRSIVVEHGLEFLSMEFGSVSDENRLYEAFAAGAEIGIPIINIGPGGKMDVEEDVQRSQANIAKWSEKAESLGVILCVKAHVNNAIYNTPTTLRMMEAVKSSGFGVDMDPSHIHRAGENAEEALAEVIQRVRHIHIRDCKGRETGPGPIELQACGRGDINLYAYCKAMVD